MCGAGNGQLSLAGSDRYNPERLGDLERHVKQQAASGTYDLDANLALLRLYSFDPDSVNFQVLGTLLVKALMQLPSTDFHLCLHLIPERYQEENTIAALISLDRHLEGARFAKFWTEVDSSRDVLNSVPKFYDAVRKYIIHMLKATFQKVSKATLSQSLRMDGASLDGLIMDSIRSEGWSLAPDGAVTFPKREASELKPQVVQNEFRFESFAPVLAVGAR